MMDEDNYRNNGRAGDDPQAAFEQLRGEVALVRLAVEGLARARESIEIPDYQPTLANTEKILLALTQRVDVIAKSPAMKLTPETMGERVNASVASATGELHNLVNSTRSDMSEAARELRGLIGTTRARWQQDRWLFWIGLGGVVLGILLYALLAGLIARAMPDSWQLPERMRSEEHTSELQSLMRISYAVFCLTKKNSTHSHPTLTRIHTSQRRTSLHQTCAINTNHTSCIV